MGQNNQNQNENGNINAKDFIIGALVGSIVGAATALLLAPKSGKELREDLNEQAIILREKTGQFKDTAIEKGNQIASTAKEKTNEWSQMIQLQSNELKNKMKSLRAQDQDQNSQPAEEEVAVDEEGNIEEKLEAAKKALDEAEENFKG